MAECTLIMDSRRYLTCVPLISGRPRPETSFFDSDIWQVKVRSDYVIISAENILRVFTCNELHGFRTPPPRMGSFFQRPFTWSIANCSVSQLKPMPASWLWSQIRMASAISSSDRLPSSDRKSSSSQNVPIHSASGGYCFSLAMSPATVTSSRHAGRDRRCRSSTSHRTPVRVPAGSVIPRPAAGRAAPEPPQRKSLSAGIFTPQVMVIDIDGKLAVIEFNTGQSEHGCVLSIRHPLAPCRHKNTA